MEFFYKDIEGTEQGPFSERQMTDWLREKLLPDDLKIRFKINGKEHSPTLARMRAKNGHKTPFIFAKCDRFDKEKGLQKELEEASKDSLAIQSAMEDLRKSLNESSIESLELLERMQRKIDVSKTVEEKKESVPRADDTPPATSAPSERKNSKARIGILPLIDVSSKNDNENDIGEDRDPVKIFRDFLDEIDLEAAQKRLKFPVDEKCRGCGHAVAQTYIRQWLCHITSKNHLDKFRLKGGQVTQSSFDWYTKQLEKFPKKKREESPADEGSVDLEKKKLEYFSGVITIPVYVPLVHIDPSDTTSLEKMRGRQEMNKLRSLIFNSTDKHNATKGLHLPTTSCEVCNEKFDYTPRIVPHFVSNAHIEKYLAKRGSFSQHDFDFWTRICKLFPEAEKDTRDEKVVRTQLKELAKEVSVESGRNVHVIYGSEDRKKHVVDFIKSRLAKYEEKVVVYVRTEEIGIDMMEYIKEHLSERRIGWANIAEICKDLEVIVTDSTLLLTEPHSIIFPYAPDEYKHKAEYVQKIIGEFVTASLIIALPKDWTNVKILVRGSATVIPPSYPPSFLTPPSEFPQVPQMTNLPPPHRIYSAHPPPPPPPPRIAPVANVHPFIPPTPPRQQYPTLPENQRIYDPNQTSPTSPVQTKKSNCSIM